MFRFLVVLLMAGAVADTAMACPLAVQGQAVIQSHAVVQAAPVAVQTFAVAQPVVVQSHAVVQQHVVQVQAQAQPVVVQQQVAACGVSCAAGRLARRIRSLSIQRSVVR